MAVDEGDPALGSPGAGAAPLGGSPSEGEVQVGRGGDGDSRVPGLDPAVPKAAAMSLGSRDPSATRSPGGGLALLSPRSLMARTQGSGRRLRAGPGKKTEIPFPQNAPRIVIDLFRYLLIRIMPVCGPLMTDSLRGS